MISRKFWELCPLPLSSVNVLSFYIFMFLVAVTKTKSTVLLILVQNGVSVMITGVRASKLCYN